MYNGVSQGDTPLPPLGGEGGLALTVPTHIQSSVYIIDVLMRVVCDIIVDRLCDIIAGRTIELTVYLFRCDGGEVGDFVLRINHRIHAYTVERKRCGRKKKKQKKEKKVLQKSLTAQP